MTQFEDLGLSESTLAAIKKKGFTEPTPIQEQAIPLLLENKADIVGQAQTGTGKTAAFGLPLIDRLKDKTGSPQAIILVPTRELALQVAQELVSYLGARKLAISAVYGGTSVVAHLKELRKGVDIVVGTPGRVIDLIERKALKLGGIEYLILDEADEMLNMGFVEDIEKIISYTPPTKRTLLFSATMPKEILKIAKRYMGEYNEINIAPKQTTAVSVDQFYLEVNDRDKLNALSRLIDIEPAFYGLVFCMTKIETDRVARWLIEHGYNAEALHGDVIQSQREKTLSLFKKRVINVVVATDVAARGIDVSDLTHVINFSLPQDTETYVHRIGRTGRAGKDGVAISIVSPGESRKFMQVKRIVKRKIKKMNIPEAEDIINARIEQLFSNVRETIDDGKTDQYEQLAEELLMMDKPERVVEALIKMNYEKAFDVKFYKKIKHAKLDFDSAQVRLFIAKGRLDEFNAKALVNFLESKTGIRKKDINNVKVMEKFSFFSVSSNNAETILKYFRKHKRGKRSIVEKAKA